jgi:hypothetical protein
MGTLSEMEKFEEEGFNLATKKDEADWTLT